MLSFDTFIIQSSAHGNCLTLRHHNVIWLLWQAENTKNGGPRIQKGASIQRDNTVMHFFIVYRSFCWESRFYSINVLNCWASCTNCSFGFFEILQYINIDSMNNSHVLKEHCTSYIPKMTLKHSRRWPQIPLMQFYSACTTGRQRQYACTYQQGGGGKRWNATNPTPSVRMAGEGGGRGGISGRRGIY